MRIVIAALGCATVAALSGCGSGTTAGTHAGGGPTASRTLTLRVTGSTADHTELDASDGDTVQLTITTDRDEEIHLHGYDIHFDCRAGTPLTKTFTADKTGQFEYEIEASSTHLGNLVVNP